MFPPTEIMKSALNMDAENEWAYPVGWLGIAEPTLRSVNIWNDVRSQLMHTIVGGLQQAYTTVHPLA